MNKKRFILGSGHMYLMEYTGTIPEDSVLEVEENKIGVISGGATLEYKPTFYTVEDDLGTVKEALLTAEETVEAFKRTAVDHNIRLMHKLSRETSFGDILEAARSTRDWKNSRAYLNIFSEYFTYMTQKQKQMALGFLYELMFHREGDIRRQAADLLGNIIARYVRGIWQGIADRCRYRSG